MYAYDNNGTVAVCRTLKGVPEGTPYIEVDTLPSRDYREAWTILNGAIYIDPDKKAAIDSELSKKARDKALATLVYDFGDGRVMQTRPKDEQNIEGAIKLLQSLSLPSIDWVMEDNKKYPTTVEELQTALDAGRLAVMQIWNNYQP